jgi:hypothetical protein
LFILAWRELHRAIPSGPLAFRVARGHTPESRAAASDRLFAQYPYHQTLSTNWRLSASL